jgi:anaerobic magnesium-protoporphyrin IX monomethyl ester cyclase
LKLIKKDITTEQILEGNRRLLPYPIRPAYLFMMGFPTETVEELGESLRLADQLLRENPKATRSFNIYTPFPGTELFSLTVGMGLEVPGRLLDWARFTYRHLPERTPWLLPETRRLISILDYALMTSVRDNSLGPVKKADPLSVWLARAYGPLANYRIKHMDARFPIELKLIGLLKRLVGRNQI